MMPTDHTKVVTQPHPNRDRILMKMRDDFISDPFMRWMFPKNAAYHKGFPRIASAYVNMAIEAGCIDSDPEENGLSIWIQPGKTARFMSLVRGVIGHVAPYRWPAFIELSQQMGHRKPKQPHWYWAFVSIAGKGRGKGLGSTFGRYGLARSDADGHPVYAEATAPHIVELWGKFGFEPLDPIVIEGQQVLYPILRQPQ